ncbi:MAG: NIPSNAP domain-containing protein [Oxalobacteraceae bacterium]|nr:MAG: NIPSNAP domain-containing protein [Oxalobacteraceae bacterium]
MLEIRTYTLASQDALDRYASIHWTRHIASLAQFGITTHHVWKQVSTDTPRLVALVEYADGADIQNVTAHYMGSAEFRADMDGFSMADILDVSSVFVEPSPADPTN